MNPRVLFLSSILVGFVFIIVSFTVAKEMWQQVDFDTTVKLQDRIPKKYDQKFSLLSILGSAEVTLSIVFLASLLSILKRKWLAVVGWMMIFPASLIEVLGKLILFHPGTSVIFHRTIVQTHLPSFYIHTNFSYPSGHVTRTIFLVTIFLVLVLTSRWKLAAKAVSSAILIIAALTMMVTRVSLGEHWLSDVVGGGLLGLSSGLFASVLILLSKKVLRE